MYYTIQDFHNFVSSGFSYNLPVEVENVFKEIEKSLNIPSSDSVTTTNVNTSHVKRNGSDRKPHKKNGKEITNEDWNIIRNFKPTKMEEKVGVDKQINDIRISINKISNKNYEAQKNNICADIQKYMESLEEDQVEDRIKIIKAIFNIASANKFYSEIYADLYKELLTLFPIFGGDILQEYIQNFKNSIHAINYVDPNVDYDGFCAYTKLNDNRKATSTFIVNLLKKSVISEGEVLDIIEYLQQLMFQYIDEANRTNEVEEITENIFIMISIGHSHLSSNAKWGKIIANVEEISKTSIKTHQSITNRSIFKHMDILQSTKK